MADDNWNPVISHGKQKRKRDYELREERIRTEAPHRSQRNQNQNLAWYNATRSPPTDTAEEYDKSHAQRYGAEEGMVDGKHRRGNPSFPIGSERDIAHAKYSESTKQKERARKSYRGARKAHTAEIDNLSPEEKGYYEHSTGGLFPTHHANLFTRALDLADSAWKNGSLRTDAEDKYPFSHHSLPQAIEHYDYAKDAFEEHEEATKKYNRHERHRSSEVDDGRRDCYDRRVTAGTFPHTRSRTQSLPPSGHYSAFLTTPPGESPNDAYYGSPSSSGRMGAGHEHSTDTSNNKK